MELDKSQSIQITFIVIFCLITFLIKVFYFFSLRSKKTYEKEDNLYKWYKSIGILSGAIIVSTIAVYPWFIWLLVKLYQEYYSKDAEILLVKLPWIIMMISAQIIIVTDLALLVKFVFLKKYTDIKIDY